MAFRSGFFNSVNGDRRYLAYRFAEYFASFIGNGVFPNPSTGMQIIADGTSRSVKIKAGKGWINGYFAVNDSDYELSLDVADGALKRIDRIVLRLDFTKREILPALKKGAFASNPVAPTLQRDADAYELGLADVLINNGATTISQANITDLRLNKDLCGIVQGTVNQVDTTTIFNQYVEWFNQTKATNQSEWEQIKQANQQDFETWFNNIKGQLEGDIATNLAVQIQNIQQDIAIHQQDYVKHPGYAIDTGTANAKIVTLDPAPTEMRDGMSVVFKNKVQNTGTVTINVNGFGAKTIKKGNGNTIASGGFKAGSIYTLRYNADTSTFILQGEGGSGNAQPSDVWKGKTFSNDSGEFTGTLDAYRAGDTVPTNKVSHKINRNTKIYTSHTGRSSKYPFFKKGRIYLFTGDYYNQIGFNAYDILTGNLIVSGSTSPVNDSVRAYFVDDIFQVYVSQYGSGSSTRFLAKFYSNGSLAWKVYPFSSQTEDIFRITANNDGTYIFVHGSSGDIKCLDQNGSLRWTVPKIYNILKIVAGVNNDVYVGVSPSSGVKKLIRIDSSGVIKWEVPFDAELSNIKLGKEGDGSIYVFDKNGKLTKISVNGIVLTELMLPKPPNGITYYDFDLDINGDIYITYRDWGIYKVYKDGSYYDLNGLTDTRVRYMSEYSSCIAVDGQNIYLYANWYGTEDGAGALIFSEEFKIV